MTTPAQPHNTLPLCRALAASPKRHQFADGLEQLLQNTEKTAQVNAMARLKGMVDAYMEADIIRPGHAAALYNELSDFVWGPLV